MLDGLCTVAGLARLHSVEYGRRVHHVGYWAFWVGGCVVRDHRGGGNKRATCARCALEQLLGMHIVKRRQNACVHMLQCASLTCLNVDEGGYVCRVGSDDALGAADKEAEVSRHVGTRARLLLLPQQHG